MKLGEIAYVTKLAGFEHTKYIQGNCVHEPLEGYIPLFIGKTVQQGEIDTQFDWYIAESISNQLQRSKLKRKCIVLPYVGTLGDMAIFSAEYDAHLGSNIAKIELNENSPYTEEFIYYYLKSTNGQKVLLRDQQGMIQKNITMEAIRNVELPDIDLEAQNRIVLTLDSISRKISLNRKANGLLESMAKQLYDYWFVQFDFPNAEGKPYKSSGGKMVYNETLKRDIPEGWEVVDLIDIANITMGQSPEGSSYNENGNGIIFYQGSTDFGIRFPEIRQYTTAPTRYASKGDILMSVRAPVGAINFANNDCCIGRGLCAMNSKIGSITHLYYTVCVFKQKFEQASQVGTTFGSITKEELHSLPVVKPKNNVIVRFEELCSPIFDKQMSISNETLRLTSLRDYLLPLLMNGQVKVS